MNTLNIQSNVISFDVAKELHAILNEHELPSYFKFVTNWETPRNELLNDGEHIITQHEKHLTRVTSRKRGHRIAPEFINAYTLQELLDFKIVGTADFVTNFDMLNSMHDIGIHKDVTITTVIGKLVVRLLTEKPVRVERAVANMKAKHFTEIEEF